MKRRRSCSEQRDAPTAAFAQPIKPVGARRRAFLGLRRACQRNQGVHTLGQTFVMNIHGTRAQLLVDAIHRSGDPWMGTRQLCTVNNDWRGVIRARADHICDEPLRGRQMRRGTPIAGKNERNAVRTRFNAIQSRVGRRGLRHEGSIAKRRDSLF